MQFQTDNENEYEEENSLSRRWNSILEIDSINKTKTSLYSMWSSLKYEIQNKFKTKFNFDSPICLLGQFYHIKMSDSINFSDKNSKVYAYEKFKQDFYSRIWLTYRKEFPSISDSNLTTDSGWGCMIRTGQMMLAQALLVHFLGRNWRWKGSKSDKEDMIHRMIISWFADVPNSSTSPFSIHQLVHLGMIKLGKKPGDWFGPSSISIVLKHALENASNLILNDICCYIAQDCTVYLEDVIDLCTNKKENVSSQDSPTSWRSIIILIPLRLGGECFNTVYSPLLREIISLPFCLGIIGGRPRQSLYFVGFQDDKLLYIDPHYCQRTIDMTQTNFSLESFHCLSPRKISLHSIDPSCTIGFYMKTKEDLDDFVLGAQQLLDQCFQSGNYPIFNIEKNRMLDCDIENEISDPDQVVRLQYRYFNPNRKVDNVYSGEEFVML